MALKEKDDQVSMNTQAIDDLATLHKQLLNRTSILEKQYTSVQEQLTKVLQKLNSIETNCFTQAKTDLSNKEKKRKTSDDDTTVEVVNPP